MTDEVPFQFNPSPAARSSGIGIPNKTATHPKPDHSGLAVADKYHCGTRALLQAPNNILDSYFNAPGGLERAWPHVDLADPTLGIARWRHTCGRCSAARDPTPIPREPWTPYLWRAQGRRGLPRLCIPDSAFGSSISLRVPPVAPEQERERVRKSARARERNSATTRKSENARKEECMPPSRIIEAGVEESQRCLLRTTALAVNRIQGGV